MIRRARLALLALGLLLGWLAMPLAPVADTRAHHDGITATTPCAVPCPETSLPQPGCAMAAGCPALAAVAPAATVTVTAITRDAIVAPARLALPDGIATAPEPRPPRHG